MEYILNPNNFNPKHQASGCIIWYGEKALFLKKKTKVSPKGFFWEIPAGKLEEGESPEKALEREVREETGIELKLFEKIKTFNMRLYTQNYDFVYHLYRSSVENDEIILSKEHEDYKWANREESRVMDLETGADIYMEYFYK